MEDFTITGGGWPIAATSSGTSPRIVCLHAGVADRRSWLSTMSDVHLPAVAYDRRGFGDTPPATETFSQTEDLAAVLDDAVDGPAILVGNSQGGRIAVDFALESPDRVAALVLIAPAISGAAEPDWIDQLGEDLVTRIEAAEEVGDLDLVNALEARVWLDGPRRPEGAVMGPARDLFLAMNGVALRNEDAPAPHQPLSAVERLHQLAMPVLVIIGALDLTHQQRRAADLAERVSDGRLVELPGVAHLPQLEQPERVADEINRFVGSLQLWQLGHQ